MRTKILIVLILFFTSYAMAQESKENSRTDKTVNVPELVKKEFTKKYPSVSKVKWGIEKAGEYEAEFKTNRVEMSVLIDDKGLILEVETEINESGLPQAVKSTLAKDFSGYKIDECEKVEANGRVTYEMEAKEGNVEYELSFDSDGKFLKKEEKKEKDND